eukprot:8057214-Karenia_brevis.AAC.1
MYGASADQQGQCGVQCWVRSTLSHRILAVLQISCRLMFAVLEIEGTLFVFAVGHAPIEHAEAADKEKFWTE